VANEKGLTDWSALRRLLQRLESIPVATMMVMVASRPEVEVDTRPMPPVVPVVMVMPVATIAAVHLLHIGVLGRWALEALQQAARRRLRG
jgi:hypothetical protein